MTHSESDTLVAPDRLQTDLRQLVSLLAESHPDSFSGAGGMLAFHRHAGEIARSIPNDGMTAAAFLRLLRPLVASVRDGHTTIFDPHQPDELIDARAMGGDPESSPRLWIDWEPLDEVLVISGVYEDRLRELLGARLNAIDGVSFRDLVARMRRLRGDDNVYNNLVHLTDALRHPALIFELLECEPRDEVHLQTLDASGSAHDTLIRLGARPGSERMAQPTTIDLVPVGPTRISWQLVDDAMLLRIGTMMWYREAFEVWRHYGYHHNLTHHLDRLLDDLGVDPRPATLDERIAAVPAASDLFIEMLDAMTTADCSQLIVDLRDATGGNSAIAAILQFLLYGLDAMVEHDGGYQVRRLSPLFFENNQNIPPESAADLPGGYDFSEERDWKQRVAGLSAEERTGIRRQIFDQAEASPTFKRLIDEHRTIAPPALDVTVLTSARTYSAGFDMAAMLYKHGATVVGVPSSQAGNCFIDTLRFTLDHSGLQGRISYKWSLLFPGDSETGKMLRPHHELTYETLAEMDFDPHAALRLALSTRS